MRSCSMGRVGVLALALGCSGAPEQAAVPDNNVDVQARCQVDGLWQFTTQGTAQQGQGCSKDGSGAQSAIVRKVRVSTGPDGALRAEQIEPSTQGSDGVSFVASSTESCGLKKHLQTHYERRHTCVDT